MIRFLASLALCICLPTYALEPVDALHVAAKEGDVDTIRQLIADGVDVNAIKEGGTPLLTATNYNSYEAVKALIALDADVNFTVGQWSPLMMAVGRDTRIVKLLLESGADVNYVEPNFRYTPLGSAAANRKDTFERLTKSGGYSGPFPDSLETVRLLIMAGANVNHVDAFMSSPLRTAMRTNNLEIAHLLLKAGADVNQRAESGGGRQETILMATVSGYSVFKDISSIRLLLDFKANPNDRNEEAYSSRFWGSRGCSVLCIAASNGHYYVVKLLLERGADPLLPRADGKTAYEVALTYYHPKTAALIDDYMQRRRSTTP